MGSQQTSSTTATAMIAMVEKDYNDTTDTYITEAEKLKFLNDGLIDIAVKTHCLQATETVNLLANTIEYTIATNYIEVDAVQYTDSSSVVKSLRPGTPKDIGLTITEGDTDAPAKWYEFNGKIGIYPALTSVTTQSVKLFIFERPTEIAGGDTIPTPAIYDNALKKYMLARMALKHKNSELYGALMGEYSQELGMYRKDLQEDNG